MTDTYYLAGDFGAGTSNLRLGTKRTSVIYSLPSLIAKTTEDRVIIGAENIYDENAFGIVEGEKTSWYYAGDMVRSRRLPSDDTFNDPNLKIENARLLMLAGIVNGLDLNKGGKPRNLKIYAVATHHDPVAFGSKLRSLLVGTHQIRKGNIVHTIDVDMPKSSIFQEGSAIGAVFGEGFDSEFATLDIGFLTALYTLRTSTGAPIQPYKSQNGVGALVELLQKDPELNKLCGGMTPDRDAIVAGLIEACRSESSKIFYRSRGQAHDITKSYKAVIGSWLAGSSRQAASDLAERRGTGFRVVAIGGGINLPFVAPALKKYGIESYSDLVTTAEDGTKPNSIVANVETLYQRHKADLRGMAGEPSDD